MQAATLILNIVHKRNKLAYFLYGPRILLVYGSGWRTVNVTSAQGNVVIFGEGLNSANISVYSFRREAFALQMVYEGV
jgi:hypothetical protein